MTVFYIIDIITCSIFLPLQLLSVLLSFNVGILFQTKKKEGDFYNSMKITRLLKYLNVVRSAFSPMFRKTFTLRRVKIKLSCIMQKMRVEICEIVIVRTQPRLVNLALTRKFSQSS